MKMLYKYPQQAFPYAKLSEENRKRNRLQPEYEILDTGVFNDNRYFDIYIEYAKADENDLLVKITAHNRYAKEAPLTILPTLWFRNTWSWGYEQFNYKPILNGIANRQIDVNHRLLGRYKFYLDGADELIFCENETNTEKMLGKPNAIPYTKDGINNYIK